MEKKRKGEKKMLLKENVKMQQQSDKSSVQNLREQGSSESFDVRAEPTRSDIDTGHQSDISQKSNIGLYWTSSYISYINALIKSSPLSSSATGL